MGLSEGHAPRLVPLKPSHKRQLPYWTLALYHPLMVFAMPHYDCDDIPTPYGAALMRATKVISDMTKEQTILYQLTQPQRYALFDPVPNSLRVVLYWFKQRDPTQPTDQDPWVSVIDPVLNGIDNLLAQLFVGVIVAPTPSLENLSQAEQALCTIYNNVYKRLVDAQGNASDPQFGDYSQDFEYAMNLLSAVKAYLSGYTH